MTKKLIIIPFVLSLLTGCMGRRVQQSAVRQPSYEINMDNDAEMYSFLGEGDLEQDDFEDWSKALEVADLDEDWDSVESDRDSITVQLDDEDNALDDRENITTDRTRC